jgi:hypothetical protein
VSRELSPESEPWQEQTPELRHEMRTSYAARRAQKAAMGPLEKALREAMTEYHKYRSAGVDRDDAERGLTEVLRGVFKLTRYPPACEECDGTGWVERRCRQWARCGRRRCQEADPNLEHTYVDTCVCEAGDRRRARPQADAPSLEAVGAGKRPSSRRPMGGFRPLGG